MRDAGNDYRDDVGDDVRWLSYSELGQVRGISTASAIRLVFRRKWRRQDGNDGTVKVAVPVDEANPQREVADNDGDGVGRDIGQVVGLLETAAAMLRERGEEADVMVAALHATAEEALARAEAETVTEREARRQAEGATGGCRGPAFPGPRRLRTRAPGGRGAACHGAGCQRKGRGGGGAAKTGKSGPPGPRFAGATARGPAEGVS